MIPRDSYINSDIKNMYFMNVRNIEGWNPSEHPVSCFNELLLWWCHFAKKELEIDQLIIKVKVFGVRGHGFFKNLISKWTI